MKKIEDLIAEAEQLAKEESDGHFTLMKFTTGYKCVLGTPDFVWLGDYEYIKELPSYEKPEEAIEAMISNKWNIKYSNTWYRAL